MMTMNIKSAGKHSCDKARQKGVNSEQMKYKNHPGTLNGKPHQKFKDRGWQKTELVFVWGSCFCGFFWSLTFIRKAARQAQPDEVNWWSELLTTLKWFPPCRGLATGIYTTNSPEACQYVAERCQANVIVVENNQQLQKILQVKDSLPCLKAIVQYTGEVAVREDFIYSVSGWILFVLVVGLFCSFQGHNCCRECVIQAVLFTFLVVKSKVCVIILFILLNYCMR